MTTFVSLPLRAPRLTVLVVVAITVILGFFARSIRIDSAIENLLPARSADRAYYEDVRKTFGSEEATLIGVFGDDLFTPAILAKIERLSSRLAGIEGVREVISLTTVKGVDASNSGVRVGRLMRELPATEAAAEEFKSRVLANPLYLGNLVAADGRATGILVLFEALTDEDFLRLNIEDRIRAAAMTEFNDPARFAISGIQALKVSGARMMQSDLMRFVPLALLLVTVVLAWSFRTRRGVLLPLSAVVIGVIWTTGIMVLAGRAITMGTLVLPPLLMAVGIAYAIHVISRYYKESRPGRSREEVVAAALNHVRLPVAIAALTTVLGFASLSLSPISAIRDFGIFSAFGIITIFLISITFLPAMLLLLPLPERRLADTPIDRSMGRLLEQVGKSAIRNRWAVLVLSALVCLLSLWGATHIRIETNYLRFFDPASSPRVENQRIAEGLGGTQAVYVVIDGDGPRSMARLDTLAAIRDLQEFIREQPGIDTSLSIVDYLALVWSVLNPDAGNRLPAAQSDVDQALLFVDPTDLRAVVTRDFSRANIVVRTRLSGSAEIGEFVKRVEDYARTRFRRGMSVHGTGSVVLLNRSADALARGQIAGLAQVLLVLLILMSVLFLSLRIGLLALVPNVIPVVILFGVMGWLDITLNISTSMMAAIAIGITVHHTIHYLEALNNQIRLTGSQELAIHNVAQTMGGPIVFTSVALAAGFLIVCLSGFQPIRHFGFLASVTMVVALLADLVVTPALVMSTRVTTLWDLLYLKLGPRPHHEIPLFAGLRPFQAKIVVLMARLASAAPGTFITRRGELKAELYVLLSGLVDVRRPGSDQVIRTLGRGDVIGEMGLVRARPRSADVVVRRDVEYLVLDRAFLDRMRRRLPRVAAKVFLNLTRILSDRLESTTDQLVEASSHDEQASGTHRL